MPETIVERGGFVSTSFGKLNSIIERVLMANFKKNMRKTAVVYMEKLTKKLLFILFFFVALVGDYIVLNSFHSGNTRIS